MATETVRGGGWRYPVFLGAAAVALASFGFLTSQHPDWFLSGEILDQLGLGKSSEPSPIARGSLAPREFTEPQLERPSTGVGGGSRGLFEGFQTEIRQSIAGSETDQNVIIAIAQQNDTYESGCFQRVNSKVDALQTELTIMQTEVSMAALEDPDAANKKAQMFQEHARSVYRELEMRMNELRLLAVGQMVCV